MKKPTATKCRDHPAISLIVHAARTLRTGTKRKMKDVIGKDDFVFRRVEGTRVSSGMLRISE